MRLARFPAFEPSGRRFDGLAMRVRTHAVRPAGVSKRPSVCESILLGAPKIFQKKSARVIAAAFCFKKNNVGILRQFSAHTWLAASMRFANSACARGIRASLHSRRSCASCARGIRASLHSRRSCASCAHGIRASLHSIASSEDSAVFKKMLEHLGRQGAVDWPKWHPLASGDADPHGLRAPVIGMTIPPGPLAARLGVPLVRGCQHLVALPAP